MIKLEDGSYLTYEMLEARYRELEAEIAAGKASLARATEIMRQLVRERDQALAESES
jgi:hypothetical protein